MQLSQAIVGFLMYKQAAGLRPRTISLYKHHLNQFLIWRGDLSLESLTATNINEFLIYLRTDYRPTRLNGDNRPLSSQSIYNTWTALKSFVRWTHETLEMSDIMSGQVPRPKAQNDQPIPFTEAEIKRLFAVVKPVKGRRSTSGLYYLTDLRDQAILLVLLDTGIRAVELCDLTIADVHLQTGRVDINGKGGKFRQVWLGKQARAIVWRYLQERPTIDPADSLFTSTTTKPLTRSALAKRLKLIGRRAGVDDVHAHRFRYTFAIEYLRNGGDPYTLQSILGHSTMKMVQYYLKLAQADVEKAHRRASPVDNWLK